MTKMQKRQKTNKKDKKKGKNDKKKGQNKGVPHCTLGCTKMSKSCQNHSAS